ncbi:hypothetical protein Glove_216g28 [Diversispora epigaea]|uniref:Uncharacterized protein n=1 Tax=Diversispora epigaea TaxID=1348612 RepID=A0A397IHH4_9GLOM|nr:hypothetical protein Glove_216g28 [Diversispora epigaea]
MQCEINSSKQEKVKLLVKKIELKAENTELLKSIIEECIENEVSITELKISLQYPILFEYIKITILKLETRNAKIKSIIEEFAKKSEFKKNHKFQKKCILIAQILFNKKSIVEYYSSFLNELKLDIFFQKCQIALEVQRAQYRFHSTSYTCRPNSKSKCRNPKCRNPKSQIPNYN